MNTSHNNLTPKITGAAAISAVVLIAIYTLVINNKVDTSNTLTTATTNATTTTTSESTTSSPSNSATVPSTTTTPTATTPTTTATPTATASSGYKDGTYTATASYTVPRGYSNTIEATITIKDGVMTAVSTNNDYTDRESGEYIDSFESSLKTAVVGKKLGTTLSSRIGGASLTTNGFLKAVTSIISEAKV